MGVNHSKILICKVSSLGHFKRRMHGDKNLKPSDPRTIQVTGPTLEEKDPFTTDEKNDGTTFLSCTSAKFKTTLRTIEATGY